MRQPVHTVAQDLPRRKSVLVFERAGWLAVRKLKTHAMDDMQQVKFSLKSFHAAEFLVLKKRTKVKAVLDARATDNPQYRSVSDPVSARSVREIREHY